jgi:hypothetical protein
MIHAASLKLSPRRAPEATTSWKFLQFDRLAVFEGSSNLSGVR